MTLILLFVNVYSIVIIEYKWLSKHLFVSSVLLILEGKSFASIALL